MFGGVIMFYILNEKTIEKANLEDLNSDITGIGYLTMEELKQNFERLKINANIFHDCIADQTHFRTSVDTYDDFSFGIINIVNVMNVKEPRDRIAFLMKKKQFILVKLIDEDDSCRIMFESAIGRFKQNATMGKVIFGILESLLLNGNKALENTEQKIMKMEQRLVDGSIDHHLNREIFNLRNELSILKNYYEQLVDIGEELQENANDLFTEEELKYFRIFTVKSQRLSNNTQALSENLIHLREALDATMNYSLNKTMQLFTVVTTIFLPLTLIVGWYGMNFTNMPELTWKYGYLTIIIISVLVVTVCLILFKKKKYF